MTNRGEVRYFLVLVLALTVMIQGSPEEVLIRGFLLIDA